MSPFFYVHMFVLIRRLMQKDVDSSVHSSQSAPVVPTDRLPLRLAPPAAAAPVVTYYEDDDPALDVSF